MNDLTIEILMVYAKVKYHDHLYKSMNEIINSCINKELGTSDFFDYISDYNHSFRYNPFTGVLCFGLNQSMLVDEKQLNKILLLNSDSRIGQDRFGKRWEIYRNMDDNTSTSIIIRIKRDLRRT